MSLFWELINSWFNKRFIASSHYYFFQNYRIFFDIGIVPMSIKIQKKLQWLKIIKLTSDRVPREVCLTVWDVLIVMDNYSTYQAFQSELSLSEKSQVAGGEHRKSCHCKRVGPYFSVEVQSSEEVWEVLSHRHGNRLWRTAFCLCVNWHWSVT